MELAAIRSRLGVSDGVDQSQDSGQTSLCEEEEETRLLEEQEEEEEREKHRTFEESQSTVERNRYLAIFQSTLKNLLLDLRLFFW